MQHSITLHLGQIALTQPGDVLGYCPVQKHIIVPLSTKQVGWHFVAECCGSHAGKVYNEFKKITDRVTGKTPHHITPPPPCFTVGTTDAEIIRSPILRLTKTWRLEPKI